MIEPIDRVFFSRNPVDVAHDLIGVAISVSGSDFYEIVETEAYGDETDLASHASVYRKARGETMRREPGRLYIYLSYGVHFCLNVVAHEPGSAGAVLIRALQPRTPGDVRGASGPGKVSRTLNIDLEFDDLDVVASDTVEFRRMAAPDQVLSSVRIGITRDVDRPWRFFNAMSPSVSGRIRVRT